MTDFSKPRRQPRDEKAPGTCNTCGGMHDHSCSVHGCGMAGTLTESTAHACAGTARWYCRDHFFASPDQRQQAGMQHVKELV